MGKIRNQPIGQLKAPPEQPGGPGNERRYGVYDGQGANTSWDAFRDAREIWADNRAEIQTYDGKAYDISDDIISGSINRVRNAATTVTITIGNEGDKYRQLFIPKDRIRIWLRRDDDEFISFTGYIRGNPYFNKISQRELTLTCECIISRFTDKEWDPNLPENILAVSSFIPDNISEQFPGIGPLDTAGAPEEGEETAPEDEEGTPEEETDGDTPPDDQTSNVLDRNDNYNDRAPSLSSVDVLEIPVEVAAPGDPGEPEEGTGGETPAPEDGDLPPEEGEEEEESPDSESMTEKYIWPDQILARLMLSDRHLNIDPDMVWIQRFPESWKRRAQLIDSMNTHCFTYWKDLIKCPETGESNPCDEGGTSGGSPTGTPSGITLGEVIDKAGFPESERERAMQTACCETGGTLDAGVVNPDGPGGASGGPTGLFQIVVSTAQGVDPGATMEKLKDPNYNAATAYKIWQQQGWAPWACGPGVGAYYGACNADSEITNYTPSASAEENQPGGPSYGGTPAPGGGPSYGGAPGPTDPGTEDTNYDDGGTGDQPEDNPAPCGTGTGSDEPGDPDAEMTGSGEPPQGWDNVDNGEIRVQYNGPDWLRDATNHAMNVWNLGGINIHYSDDNPTVIIDTGDLGGSTLGNTNSGGPMTIRTDGYTWTANALRAVMVHEFGHALGFPHESGSPSSMQPSMQTDSDSNPDTPTEYDRNLYSQVWGGGGGGPSSGESSNVMERDMVAMGIDPDSPLPAPEYELPPPLVAAIEEGPTFSPPVLDSAYGGLDGNRADYEETKVVRVINHHRRRMGRYGVVLNADLMRAARKHLEDIRRSGILSHNTTDAVDYYQTDISAADRARIEGYPGDRIGESILWSDTDPTGELAVSQMYFSPAHRNVMLEQDWRSIGVARAEGEDGWYWVVVYGDQEWSHNPHVQATLTGSRGRAIYKPEERNTRIRDFAELGKRCKGAPHMWGGGQADRIYRSPEAMIRGGVDNAGLFNSLRRMFGLRPYNIGGTIDWWNFLADKKPFDENKMYPIGTFLINAGEGGPGGGNGLGHIGMVVDDRGTVLEITRGTGRVSTVNNVWQSNQHWRGYTHIGYMPDLGTVTYKQHTIKPPKISHAPAGFREQFQLAAVNADRDVTAAQESGWVGPVAEVNSIIEKKFNVNGTTYGGHGVTDTGVDGLAYSIDWVLGAWCTAATGENRSIGDELVGFLETNWEAFNLDYVIWQGMWNHGSGWEPYDPSSYGLSTCPASDMHDDHTHATFHTDGKPVGEYKDDGRTFNPEGGYEGGDEGGGGGPEGSGGVVDPEPCMMKNPLGVFRLAFVLPGMNQSVFVRSAALSGGDLVATLEAQAAHEDTALNKSTEWAMIPTKSEDTHKDWLEIAELLKEPYLPTIQSVAAAGMFTFMSVGSGPVVFWYPDFLIEIADYLLLPDNWATMSEEEKKEYWDQMAMPEKASMYSSMSDEYFREQFPWVSDEEIDAMQTFLSNNPELSPEALPSDQAYKNTPYENEDVDMLTRPMVVEDLELKDFRLSISDSYLVTHYFVMGEYRSMGESFPEMMYDTLCWEWASIKYHPFLNRLSEKQQFDWESFIQRYGSRTLRETQTAIKTPGLAKLYADNQFLIRWLQNYTIEVDIAFMPQLYPGMRLRIKSLGIQVVILSVTHTFGNRFTTTVSCSMPLAIDDQNKIPPIPFWALGTRDDTRIPMPTEQLQNPNTSDGLPETGARGPDETAQKELIEDWRQRRDRSDKFIERFRNQYPRRGSTR